MAREAFMRHGRERIDRIDAGIVRIHPQLLHRISIQRRDVEIRGDPAVRGDLLIDILDLIAEVLHLREAVEDLALQILKDLIIARIPGLGQILAQHLFRLLRISHRIHLQLLQMLVERLFHHGFDFLRRLVRSDALLQKQRIVLLSIFELRQSLFIVFAG